MNNFKCPICGGKLNITIGSKVATCESCGNVSEIEPADVANFEAVYRSAEQSMRLNTAEGYGEALRALESIPFVYEAREKAEYCRQRLDELEAERERRQEFEQLSDKRDTVVGVILLVFMVIFCVAAVAGAGYLIFQFARGSLSPKTVTTIIIIAVVAAALVVVNKMRR